MSSPDDSNDVSLGRRDSWSRYWANGSLQACMVGNGNRDSELLTFWQRVFTEVPPASRMLDIATGNGALPKLAIACLGEATTVQIEAIDIAELRPDWLQALPAHQRETIRFHGGVAAEALPFQSASMNLVVSQFGLEYTDWSRSLAEIRRVLLPDGQIALVIHDVESLIVSQAKEERSHLAWVAENQLFEMAKQMCEPMARAATSDGRTALNQDESARRLRSVFNQLLAATQVRAKGSQCPDVLFEILETIMRELAACGQTGLADSSQQRLEQLANLYSDMDFRLNELIRFARSEMDVRQLAEALAMKVESLSPLRTPTGEKLAWGLRARYQSR